MKFLAFDKKKCKHTWFMENMDLNGKEVLVDLTCRECGKKKKEVMHRKDEE